MMMCFLRRSTLICCALTLFLLFLLYPCHAFSEETLDDALKPDQDVEEELKYLQAETYVITPSKIPQRIEKAPGTVHVVTEKEIRQIGARYLSDVVQTVPGWFVEQWFAGFTNFFVRGSAGTLSNSILFMVNSHVVNNVNFGTGVLGYSNLDLDNVKQIEFVSGPGSSLYGSGAKAGIINIITKEGDDIDGLQLTGRGGSFNTWEGNALFGKNFNGLEVSAYLDYRNTDGFHGHVDEDQQSVLDKRYGTHASLAPGSMKGDAYDWDAQLTMKYNGLKFDGKYIDKKWDNPFGARPILDNMSDYSDKEYYLNLSYDTTPAEGLDVMVKAYLNQQETGERTQMFPKGSVIMTPIGPTITTQNRFYEGGMKNSRMGAEAQATYEIVDANTIVGGVIFERQKLWDFNRKANFLRTSNPYVFIPLPSVQDEPDSWKIPDKDRNVYAAYVEDIWDIRDNLRLTAGLRYDYYTESGGQLSPRLGVNWEFYQEFYTKFLYGQAFRAPYFVDLYHPAWGNPDLKNETEDTYELSLGADFQPFSCQVTGFYNKMEDAITLAQDSSTGVLRYQYINADSIKLYGAELQMKYDFGRGTYLSMNYTQMKVDTGNSGTDIWMEPTRLGTLTGNVRLNRYLNLNAQLIYRGGWHREDGDPREDPGDYAIVNATLIAKDFVKELKGLEVRGSVLNLLNKDYTMPTAAGELPNDMPMPGINFFVELRYTF